MVYSLKELVIPGRNGMMFKTANDLADELLNWFRGFPQENNMHRQLFRRNLKDFQSWGWQDEWTKVALPVFLAIK